MDLRCTLKVLSRTKLDVGIIRESVKLFNKKRNQISQSLINEKPNFDGCL